MNLIFDFSGTLSDDRELAWKLTDATLRELGGKGVDLATYQSEFALPAQGFYATHLPDHEFTQIEAVFARLTRERYAEAVNLVPGVSEALPCLARRHALFVFSTLDAQALDQALVRVGLATYFRDVRGQAGDKRESLARYVAEQGLHPDDTAYIGDTDHDMDAAAAAHVAGWAVTWGHGKLADLSLKTEVVCHTFAEVEAEVARREWAASRAYPVATVGGLILDQQENVLLVRTRKWLGKWGIPGGKVDYGETLEAALRREILEETHLVVGEVRFIMLHDSIESKEFYRPRHFILTNFAARVAGNQPDFQLNHEGVAARWVSLSDAETLDLNTPTRKLLEAYRFRGGWMGLQGVQF